MYEEFLVSLGQALVSGLQNSIRENKVESIRCETPVRYVDGISKYDFERLARLCAKDYPRIVRVDLYPATVVCTVRSVSGISDWRFTVDFNDWGHFSGTRWTRQENTESSIPHSYASRLGKALESIRSGRPFFDSLNTYVEKNSDLATDDGLCVNEGIGLMKRAFGKIQYLSTGYNSAVLVGEHAYPVLSILKDRGFKKIRTTRIFDVDDTSLHYSYEVQEIRIGGKSSFFANDIFSEDVDIEILCHSKKKITLPHSVSKYNKKPEDEVSSDLFRMGFTNIYTRRILDYPLGRNVNDYCTGRVIIDNKYNCTSGMCFDYDVKIVIEYYLSR